MTLGKQPKKRDKEATIQKLLETGVQIFSQYGYDAATTKLISKHSGINESLISRYFDGKAGLLVEIMRSFIQKECDHGTQASYIQGKTLEEDILNFFHYKFQHYITIQPFLKVVFSRALIDPLVAKEIQKKTNKGSSPQLLERLQYFKENGQVRQDVNLDRACFIITNTCFSLGFLGLTIMGLGKEEVLSALADFAHNFTNGIKR